MWLSQGMSATPNRGLAIGASGLLQHAALEVEEGGGLEEEGGEGAGGSIGEAVALVGAGPGIGQGGGDLAESVEEGFKDGNGGHTLCLKAESEKSSPPEIGPSFRKLRRQKTQNRRQFRIAGQSTSLPGKDRRFDGCHPAMRPISSTPAADVWPQRSSWVSTSSLFRRQAPALSGLAV